MIRHMAVFRFKPEVDAQQRQQWIDMIKALPQHIPEIKALTIGADIVGSPVAYEVGLVVDFESLEAMDAYNEHPEHLKVLAFSGPMKEHLAVVDFEF